MLSSDQTCAPCRQGSRQRERHPFARRVAPPDSDHDVLAAVDHVRHRRAACPTRELDFTDDRASLLVVGSEHLAAGPTPELRQCRESDVGSLPGKQQRRRDEHRRAAGLAEPGHVEILERRVISRTFSIRHLPDDLALVQIDGRDTSVGWLEEGQALRTDDRHVSSACVAHVRARMK